MVGTKLTKKLFWWLPQKGERSSSIQEFTKCAVWIVLTFLALWDVTAAKPSYNGDLFSANGAAAYQGLSRWVWSCYVLWIIVACEEGWAPALNVSFLKFFNGFEEKTIFLKTEIFLKKTNIFIVFI